MDHQAIENLRAALRESPHNIPLKRMLAESLLRAGLWDEAEQKYSELLAISEEDSYKTALARIFFARGEYSKCNVLLEALLNSNYDDMDARCCTPKPSCANNNRRPPARHTAKCWNSTPDLQMKN